MPVLFNLGNDAHNTIAKRAMRLLSGQWDTPLRWMQGIHENCHPPTCDLFLLTFKSFTTNELIHALAKPISGQTQDNYYNKFAFR
ncbi:hypothetical protein TNCV_3932391 [Trichonephila clavipes]|nr:hypothetical protein TNCV_3932391 [Trichonephila clavipes]